MPVCSWLETIEDMRQKVSVIPTPVSATMIRTYDSDVFGASRTDTVP